MYFLYNNPTGNVTVYVVNSEAQVETLATGLGLTSADYGVFDNLDLLPTGWQSFENGVTFTGGSTPSYGYSFPLAQEQAKTEVKLQNASIAGPDANNLSPYLLSQQASIPAGSRLSIVQAAFDQIANTAALLQSQLDAIDAATDIAELNAIVNPPVISGQISLERNGLALEPSNFVTLIGCNPEDLVLYIPALVPVTLNYNPALPGYTSSGADVFDFVFPPAYICELRYATNLVGTFNIEDDVTPTVFNFEFTPTPTYPPLEV